LRNAGSKAARMVSAVIASAEQSCWPPGEVRGFRPPRGDRRVGEPDRQTAPPSQCRVNILASW
jgi:hypothetical protein